MQALFLAVLLVFVASAPSLAGDDPSLILERSRLEQAATDSWSQIASRYGSESRMDQQLSPNDEEPRVGTIDSGQGASRPLAAAEEPRGIDWKPLLLESVHATTWQQAFRLLWEDDSRKRLTQVPMFRNWQENVKALDHWDDKGPTAINYVAHPLMGATSGRLLLNHDARGRVVRPSDEGYWASRFRALAFSVAYSTQWEVGPLSEAMLGLSPEKEGVVDLVITPTVGFAWMLAEDALEEHLVRRIERRGSATWTRVARMVFSPSRMLANVAGLRVPWHRADRGLRDEFERARANGREN
jgi:hypothetical protein